MNEVLLRNMTLTELERHYWLTKPDGMEHYLAETAVELSDEIDQMELEFGEFDLIPSKLSADDSVKTKQNR